MLLVCQRQSAALVLYLSNSHQLHAAVTADQMLSDDELAGFVEFGADPDDVLAAQRSTLQAQQGEVQQEDGAGGRRSRRGRQGPGGRGGRQQQVPDELLPKVAIVGRPNVGKSGE